MPGTAERMDYVLLRRRCGLQQVAKLKPRITGSTELGLTLSHHDLSPIQAHPHYPNPIKASSQWFCSGVVCGTNQKEGHSRTLDNVSGDVSRPIAPSATTNAALSQQPILYSRDECHIPHPVFTLFVHLAKQGVRVSDMFRRPGNVAHMKFILERFTAGEAIPWDEYNVYTVANVAKKLLLSIPGGLFGPAGEAELLATANHSSCASELTELGTPCSTPLQQHDPCHDDTDTKCLFGDHKTVTFVIDSDDCTSRPIKPTALLRWPLSTIRQMQQLYETGEKRITVCLRVLDTLPPSHQQTIILMLGILHHLIFRSTSIEDTWTSLVSHAHTCSTSGQDDSMPNIPLLTLAEGVVKSVAGTMFHTCSTSVSRVEQAAQVLRSLVIYFPTMGDSITQFYSDAMAGRLPLSTASCYPTLGFDSKTQKLAILAALLSGGNKSICVLCPKADHYLYFDKLSLGSCERRPCPTNLLQAASRLFCLGGSTTPIHSKSTSVTGIWAKRNARKLYFKKAWTDQVATRSHADSFGQRPNKNASSHRGSVVDVPTSQSDDLILEQGPPSSNQNVENQSNQINDVDLHTERPVPMLLRRNQSRYRSLRRRQMENLSRRAEWFLGPTVLPVVTLRPSWYSCDPHPHTHCDTFGSAELVVQSTVSLLELGDPTSTNGNTAGNRLHILAPPHLLFTASTGELRQPGHRDCNPEGIKSGPRLESGRKRLLSVGSSLAATSTNSFVSVNSAPPPGFTSDNDTDLRYGYCHCVKKTPPSPSPRARSTSPRPIEISPCSIFITDYITRLPTDISDGQGKNDAQTCLDRPILQSTIPVINEPTSS